MIVINKAILHILDFNTGMTAFSDELLQPIGGIEEFLCKHIEKSIASQEAKPGIFYEDSECKKLLIAYLSDEMEFVPFSKEIAHIFEQALSHAEEMVSADLVICDLCIEEKRKIAIFKCNSHMGFVHQITQTAAGTKNDIIDHYAILPNLTQKIEEFAFIDAQTMDISLLAKKYTIDGNSIFILPEILLECAQKPSPKETIKKISQTVKQVAEAYGQDNVAAAAAMKTYIAENMEISPQLDPQEAGKAVFRDNPAMQAEYNQQLQDAGFTEPVAMDQESTLKKMRNHKLKTDTGIELTIPTDYFENTEFVEFNRNEDGSLSITLKHIQNIMNRG